MAKIIEFYVPQSFQKITKWVAAEKRGQLIELPIRKKSA
jgi:hypothetical protein